MKRLIGMLALRAISSAAVVCGLSLLPCVQVDAQQAEHMVVDAKAATTPFPHFWEQTFGSGRAILALRQSYRDDLRAVKQATDFQSVRFHGIFNDEVGLYDPDRKTIEFAQTAGQTGTKVGDNSSYNFSYVDQIYDGLLEIGVRPYVEMSFMPKKMASDATKVHPFWYHPNVSPPKDYAEWDAMIAAFARHLIERYGVGEVATWKFEVWNEPNIDFWQGEPKQPSYFTLYDHTARALKSVSTRLQVGGPSTAQAGWVAAFLAHTKAEDVPVDFVSTHVYANDTAKDVFGTNEQIPRDTMVARAVRKVHDEIAKSGYAKMPLIFSEYNASYANEPNITDTTYMGPWLANTIRQVDGLVDNMDYWAFSDVFEEQGVVRTPFYGGFGLMAADGIPKPAFNVFRILHWLGDRRLATESDSALVTEDASGKLALALWNYAPPDGTGAKYTTPKGPAGPPKMFEVELRNTSASSAEVWRVDDDHGNVIKAFDAMERPAGSLTKSQVAKLRAAGQLGSPERVRVDHGRLQISVPAHGLAVVLVGK